MIIRYALFEGTVHAGMEDSFRLFVRERLVPLWTRFPGAQEIRVLDGIDRDIGAPSYAMALAIRYPDMPTCEAALNSAARYQSRAVTGDLLKMFTGRVHHHIFEAAEFPPA